MFKVKSLSEIVNCLDFHSPNAYFTIKEYELVLEMEGYYLIDDLPIQYFPFKFQDQAEFLKKLSKADSFLNQCFNYPGEYGQVTLYTIIVKYGKIPNRALDLGKEDIVTLIENYESKKFLDRFFINQGKVFFSESMSYINEHRYANMAPILMEKGVLRVGEDRDLQEVLKFKTKDELIEILRESISLESSKRFANKTKTEIINFLISERDFSRLNIPEHFYFLSDTYQEFKEWIIKEEIYFNVYYFLHIEIGMAGYYIDSLVKKLKRIKEISLAERINNLRAIIYQNNLLE